MDTDRVAELQRWELSGAVWSIVSRKQDRVTVALLRCDGGEEVDRFTSYVPGRSTTSASGRSTEG